MRTQRLRPRVRAEKEFRDAARKNRRVFVCASTHYSHLCNTDHIKPGWGVGAGWRGAGGRRGVWGRGGRGGWGLRGGGGRSQKG
ncbi:hypothetical protein DBO26_08390 [Salmonella enterica subsp. enterica]|nr:hypothetical protein DBO26_08390 [Salmonella enterica subsp. enterica]